MLLNPIQPRSQFGGSDLAVNGRHVLSSSLLAFVGSLRGRSGLLAAFDLTDGTKFTPGSVTTFRGSAQRWGCWNFTGASGSSLESAATKFSKTGGVLGKNLSLSIWYRTSASAGNYGMITLNNNAASAIFGLVVVSSAISVATNGINNSFASAFKNDSKWHNFIGTWDGTTITAYQDGNSIGTISQSTASSGVSRLTIGNRGAGSLFFNGDLDGAMCWQRTLNDNEAFQVYQEGLKGYPTLISRQSRGFAGSFDGTVYSLATTLGVGGGVGESFAPAMGIAMTLAASSAVSANDAASILKSAQSLAATFGIQEVTQEVVGIVAGLSASTGISDGLNQSAALQVAAAIRAGIQESSQSVALCLVSLGVSAGQVQSAVAVYQLAMSLAIQAGLSGVESGAATVTAQLIRLILESWSKSTISGESWSKSTISGESWE